MKPSTYCIYKGIGAAKIGLILPTEGDKGYVEKDGAVLIDATRSTGKPPRGQLPEYNWKDKIVFAIGMNDIVLLNGDMYKKLVHDHRGVIKTFQIVEGEGEYAGTWRMELSEKGTDGAFRNVMVPLTEGELKVFLKLLDRAIPTIIGW